METQRQGNGWQTFIEHWGFLIAVIAILLISQLLFDLRGAPWIWFFTLLFVGSSLIGYAKFSVYRSDRFFTFGVNSVPEDLRGYYRWGWRVFLFGAVLSLCLLLSRL